MMIVVQLWRSKADGKLMRVDHGTKYIHLAGETIEGGISEEHVLMLNFLKLYDRAKHIIKGYRSDFGTRELRKAMRGHRTKLHIQLEQPG